MCCNVYRALPFVSIRSVREKDERRDSEGGGWLQGMTGVHRLAIVVLSTCTLAVKDGDCWVLGPAGPLCPNLGLKHASSPSINCTCGRQRTAPVAWSDGGVWRTDG
ncbi:hypothetical protein E2C01_035860 [Portunus trituberculatus]|uniref:Uncharacterized protein n=1 Tax=Portunus trituberculatus TaxID=210409 RepID=A0A5B7FAV1_PORTR|nr:hypothetical protein [Portunus trituberculatus]